MTSILALLYHVEVSHEETKSSRVSDVVEVAVCVSKIM